MPDSDNEKPVKLNTAFLTGPGGLVYEIPLEVAARYVVTPERIKELGHLPIQPHRVEQTTVHPSMERGSETEESDVEGRHLGLGVDQYGDYTSWHSDCRYGAYVGVDGQSYFGIHRHPWGTELGVSCND